MKKVQIILLMFLFFTLSNHALCASKYVTRHYDVETKDKQLLHATLTYPKTKLKTYPTVLLLHSFGYSASYWQSMADELNDKGFAVLRFDFRGHGKSVYNTSFKRKSYRAFKTADYLNFPSDTLKVIELVQSETKKASFTDWVIVGADIGANTAVLVAKQSKIKPRALVLISPSMSFKGLYIPVAMTEIGHTPILAIASKKDVYSMNEQAKLVKFAQGNFDVINTPQGGMGMLLIKSNPGLQSSILKWITTKH